MDAGAVGAAVEEDARRALAAVVDLVPGDLDVVAALGSDDTFAHTQKNKQIEIK